MWALSPLLSPSSSPQGCRGLWYRLLSLLRAAQPWHYTLKQIGGRFGSSVLSYFLFLKTLLMLNFFSFFILLVFVVILQAVYPPAPVSPQPFTGLELLTGVVSMAQAPPGAHFPTVIISQFLPSCSLGPRTTGAVGAQGGAAPAQGSVSLRLAQRCQAKQEAVSTAEVTVGPMVCFPAGLLHALAAVLWLLQQHHPK